MAFQRYAFFLSLCLLECYGFLENPNNPQTPLSFMVLGDWGGLPFFPYTTPVQTAVRDQMVTYALQHHPRFVVSLGDNFYLYGVENADDTRFNLTFEEVYSDPSLHIPWYVTAGNHDHYGNVTAQIEYSKISNRWKFPDYYQKITSHAPGGRSVDVILIDTIVLCGNVYDSHVPPVGPADSGAAAAQWAWLEESLKQSRADYIVVGGHYPVYSVGDHGPSACLRRQLEPLLHTYRVSAYIAGHDHNLQHIQMARNSSSVTNNAMDYFIVGSGNFVDARRLHFDDIPETQVKLFFGELLHFGGFACFEVSGDTMTVKMIDGLGNLLYQYPIHPRK
ncbi:hypothetical protein DPMN_083319 [Dreissena polymorpha]|uniref:Tartrate-resistant acid phosphatase type 5 n=2 Tax=Dreissena polymorpha TaxID=45954 RepID=A0A9D3YBP8_DREPO|nr:hypothetical protein DPMN_083319 [Dreissena polymorpha]